MMLSSPTYLRKKLKCLCQTWHAKCSYADSCVHKAINSNFILLSVSEQMPKGGQIIRSIQPLLKNSIDMQDYSRVLYMVSCSWNLKLMICLAELSSRLQPLQKEECPGTESSHKRCSFGKGISRQPYPCKILIKFCKEAGLNFEPRTSRP